MAQLKTTFAGIQLENPVIVSSSGLTDSTEKIKALEAAGAGAVVLKSVFEEQIGAESGHIQDSGLGADDYLQAYVRSHALNGHVSLVKEAKEGCSIPVIASINCYSSGEWVEYARQIESAGADALEVNLYDLSVDPQTSPASIEENYLKVIKTIVSELKIPVAVKIGPHFTSIVNFVDRAASSGAKGVVIFNRFFTPDIDIENFRLVPATPLSHEGEYAETLRWTAILSSAVSSIDIAATTGIHTPESAVKEILAGASAVQICSVVYKKGPAVITEFNDYIRHFLEKNTVGTLSQIRGRLNYSTIPDPAMYERVQFIKTFGSLAL